MILIYADGSRKEAALLARTENRMRVAIPGGDDPIELTEVCGAWVTEDCEVVRVEFAWESKTNKQVITEADCICSHDLAARLLRLLWNADEECSLKSAVPADAEALLALAACN